MLALHLMHRQNYLTQEELEILNRIVTMYLDFAELQAKNHRQMFVKDWREKLDAFLQFVGQEILQNAGNITKQVEDKLAADKYEQFRLQQIEKKNDSVDDIDNAIKNLE